MPGLKLAPKSDQSDYEIETPTVGPYDLAVGIQNPGLGRRVRPGVVADNLATLLAAASDGDTFILLPGTHTLVTSIIVTNARITIIGSRGTSIVGPGGLAQLIEISTGADDFRLIGVSLEAMATDSECIKVTAAVDRGIIENVHFQKAATTTTGSGIEFAANADEWQILKCDFDGTNLLHCVHGSGSVVIQRLQIISGTCRSGNNDQISFENSGGTDDSIISGMTFSGGSQDQIAFSSNANRNSITGCTFSGSADDCIELGVNCDQCIVTGCTFIGGASTTNAINILGEGNTITGNTIIGAATPAGVGILITGAGAIRNIVSNNHIDSWVTGLNIASSAGIGNKLNGNVFGTANTTDLTISADGQITEFSLNPLTFPASVFGPVSASDFPINTLAAIAADENDNSLQVARMADAGNRAFSLDEIGAPVDAQRLKISGSVRQDDAVPAAGNVQLSWYERRTDGNPTAFPAVGSPNADLAVVALLADEDWVDFSEEFALSALGMAADQVHQIMFARRPAEAGDSLGKDVRMKNLKLTFI